MKQREDVCAYCEQFRAATSASRTRSEQDCVKKLNEWSEHIALAQDERTYYNSSCQRGKNAIQANEQPLSYSHLTFDFAENFALPYHARQPGPVYFKVLFRVNDFGIIDEGKQQQAHYLFTEAETIGADNAKSHGPNNVISMLLRSTQLSTIKCSLACDNCVGQNKNKSVMAYMAWRILAGLEDSIDLSFMVVGHTRCAVDVGFGLAKKKFRASNTDTYDQLVQLITV